MTERLALAIILVLGVTLRLVQYLGDRSLWLDEALLAPQIIQRSLLELLNPAITAPTPPGFMVAAKAATMLLGDNEYALRLVPLLAGVGGLFLFLAVARRYLTREAVPLALAMFAVSPFVVYYASEVKQYSTDVLASLLLLWLAADLRARDVDARRILLWGAAGLAIIPLSLTSAFVFVGVSSALVVHHASSRNPRPARLLAGALAVWGLALGVPYLLLIAPHADGGSYLRAFWQSGFMPLPPRSLGDLGWFPTALVRTFRDPLGVIGDLQTQSGFYQAAAGILAFVAGLSWLASRRRLELGMLALPILVTLLASGLKMYPFGGSWTTGGRVILFLAPAFFLVMGEGAAQLRRRLQPSMNFVGVALIVLLLLPPLAWAAVAVPYPRTEVKPLIAAMQEHWQPGDVLYVHYDVKHAFAYYAPKYGLGPGEIHLGPCARTAPQGYVEALSGLVGGPRVWVLFGGGIGAKRFDEREFMLSYLDHVGRQVAAQATVGAHLYLYDLSGGPRDTGPLQMQIPVIPQSVEEGCALWS